MRENEKGLPSGRPIAGGKYVAPATSKGKIVNVAEKGSEDCGGQKRPGGEAAQRGKNLKVGFSAETSSSSPRRYWGVLGDCCRP